MNQSWSSIRKKLEQEYLCEALRGRVQYFFTLYHAGPDEPGRFAVRVDGEEVWCAHAYQEGTYDRIAGELKKQWQIPRRDWDGKRILNEEENRAAEEQAVRMANEMGIASTWDVIGAIREYLNLNITDALRSTNAVIRMLAILDRRVGKRTLEKLGTLWEHEPSWLKSFLALRTQAEGLPQKENSAAKDGDPAERKSFE